MEIKLSDHAKDQIKGRHIPKNLVTETIRNPDQILKSFKDRRLLRKRLDDRILEVVTAYFLKEDKL